MTRNTCSAASVGSALLYAGNYYNANHSGYGLDDSDLAVILVARHDSTPFAYNDTVWATGAYAATGLDACYGAIARYVFDVGAWENCQWVIFHGASGQPGSRHYMDQFPLWYRGEHHPHWLDRADVEANLEGALKLEP